MVGEREREKEREREREREEVRWWLVELILCCLELMLFAGIASCRLSELVSGISITTYNRKVNTLE